MAEMNQDEIQKKMGLLFLAIKQAQQEGSAVRSKDGAERVCSTREREREGERT